MAVRALLPEVKFRITCSKKKELVVAKWLVLFLCLCWNCKISTADFLCTLAANYYLQGLQKL